MICPPEELPVHWDEAFGGHPLKSRPFLKHLALQNPVNQKYFWETDQKGVLAGCIFRANIPFVLNRLVIYRQASFCGIPMPFGVEPGFAPAREVDKVAEIMNGAWPGFQIIHGLSEKGEEIPGWTWKRHLLAVDFPVNFKNFDEYLQKLRHNYRKLINRSMRKWGDISVKGQSHDAFDDAEYNLYLSVLGRQKYKTEALGIGFFRNIPVEHYFIKAYLGTRLVGWILLVPYGADLYTLFLGIDRELNNNYDTYFNIFLETIKYAIENGFSRIRFGQTAELTKLRLGGVPLERYMLVRHTNPVVNQIIKKTDIFNYRKHYPPQHIFKTSERQYRNKIA